jgi:hypothetical protein
MAHAGGRPLEYKQEFVGEVAKYLSKCKDEETEFHKTRGEKSDTYERVVKVKLPSIEGLAEHLRVSRETIYDWKSKYKEFSDTLDEILVKQHNALVSGGLSGTYSPVIAKLLLSSNHGYKEKSDLTTDGEKISFVIPQDVANKYTNTDTSAE